MTEEQQLMISDCETRCGRMNDWECQFIDSISARDSLTEAQNQTLNVIWDRVTEEG